MSVNVTERRVTEWGGAEEVVSLEALVYSLNKAKMK